MVLRLTAESGAGSPLASVIATIEELVRKCNVAPLPITSDLYAHRVLDKCADDYLKDCGSLTGQDLKRLEMDFSACLHSFRATFQQHSKGVVLEYYMSVEDALPKHLPDGYMVEWFESISEASHKTIESTKEGPLPLTRC